MKKKFIYILVGVILTIGVLGAAGYVYAQVSDTRDGDTSEGMEQDSDRIFPGVQGFRWFGFDSDEGLLREYFFKEFAGVFELSDEAVAAFEKVMETMDEIRSQYTIDEVRELMKEAITSAVNAALADGEITQEQADQMLARIEKEGFGDYRNFDHRGKKGGFPGEDFPFFKSKMMGQYLEAAFAEALGLTIEEFQALKADEGFNIVEYAEGQNMTKEELEQWMMEIHTNAINAALEDDAITQDQADALLEQLENSPGRLPFMPLFEDRGPHH